MKMMSREKTGKSTAAPLKAKHLLLEGGACSRTSRVWNSYKYVMRVALRAFPAAPPCMLTLTSSIT